MRRSSRASAAATSSLVAMCLTTWASISPSSLRVVFFGALRRKYSTAIGQHRWCVVRCARRRGSAYVREPTCSRIMPVRDCAECRHQSWKGALAPVGVAKPRQQSPDLHSLPLPGSAWGRDAAFVKRSCNILQTRYAGRLHVSDDGSKFSCPRIRARCSGLSGGIPSLGLITSADYHGRALVK